MRDTARQKKERAANEADLLLGPDPGFQGMPPLATAQSVPANICLTPPLTPSKNQVSKHLLTKSLAKLNREATI